MSIDDIDADTKNEVQNFKYINVEMKITHIIIRGPYRS